MGSQLWVAPQGDPYSVHVNRMVSGRWGDVVITGRVPGSGVARPQALEAAVVRHIRTTGSSVGGTMVDSRSPGPAVGREGKG